MTEEKARTFLRNLPYEQGFHFFSPDGYYLGETATTLCFFQQDLQREDIRSIRFHFDKGDFRRWLRTTIGDEELAQKIDEIDKRISDEVLRQQLVETVQKRISILKNIEL